MTSPLRRLAARVHRSATAIGLESARAIEEDRRSRHDPLGARAPYATEMVVRELLASAGGVDRLHDAAGFVEFLHTCIEPRGFDVTWLRRASGIDEHAHRFEAIVARLASETPPIPVATALEIARVLDDLKANRQHYQEGLWLGDVGTHAQAGSSDGRMGRVLATAVRFGRPVRCLELGTAYGVSALFLLAELDRTSPTGRLCTVEIREPQFSIARTLLESRYPDRVRCELVGRADDLPRLLPQIGPVDLVFHDAEHSGAAYRRDFELLVPHLSSGAVVIFDNIRWNHRVFSGGESGTYEGWRVLAEDQRVVSAAEVTGGDVGDAWGLLLVGAPASTS